MELYVVRHGQTDWNKNRFMQGRTDVPLNQNGIDQANEVKSKLKGITFKKCYVSPLIRAKQTAEIITNCTLIIDDRLLEREYGDLEGVHNVSSSVLEKQWDFKLNTKENNIETLKELLERVHMFNEELLDDNTDEKILIVSHGATTKALHYDLIGYNENTDFLSFKLKNCEICKYIIKDKQVISFEIIN